VVPSPRYLYTLRGLTPLEAAPLADAGVTAYRAVRRAIPLLTDSRSTAVIIGAGGLGQFALQYIKIFTSARVIVVEPLAERRRLAKDLGADETLPSIARDVRELGAAVFDFVGTDATLAQSVALVRRQGMVVQVGEAGGRVFFGLGLLPYEAVLTTSIWGSARDLQSVLDLAWSRLIRWDVEPLPLENVNQALGRLRDGQVRGRLVITP
jgi:alcohol dehydrogenase, propanol-preferring